MPQIFLILYAAYIFAHPLPNKVLSTGLGRIVPNLISRKHTNSAATGTYVLLVLNVFHIVMLTLILYIADVSIMQVLCRPGWRLRKDDYSSPKLYGQNGDTLVLTCTTQFIQDPAWEKKSSILHLIISPNIIVMINKFFPLELKTVYLKPGHLCGDVELFYLNWKCTETHYWLMLKNSIKYLKHQSLVWL